MKKKKRKKERTQSKFENAIIAGMRTAFKRYAPVYKQIIDMTRIEKKIYNKDGELSKKIAVFNICNECKQEIKPENIEVDHIDPVIEYGKTRKDYTLDEIKERLDCNIENLQVLCKECHKKKSEHEKTIRKKLKENKELK